MSGSNRAVVRAAVEAWNAADFDRIDELYAPDYVHHNNAAAMTLERFKRGMAWFRSGMPDVELKIEEMLAERDLVAVRLTGRGTHLGSLFGEAPTERTIHLFGTIIYRVQDGRIAEDWEAYDEADIQRQMGAEAS